jgi:hypothetical protein
MALLSPWPVAAEQGSIPLDGLYRTQEPDSRSRAQFIGYNFGGTPQSGLDEGFVANLWMNAVPPKSGSDQQLPFMMSLCNIGNAGIAPQSA